MKKTIQFIPEVTSADIIRRIMKIYQLLTFLLQWDILRDDFKFNFIVFVDFVLIFHYLGSTINTVVTKWHDMELVLRALCLEGLNLQLLVKGVTIVYYAKSINALFAFVLDVCNESKGHYQEIMMKWTKRLMTLTKVQISVYFGNAALFCLYPIYGYYVLNEKVTLYDLLLPFDRETKGGYAMIITIQVCLTYATTVLVFGVDSLFLTLIFSGRTLFDLFDADCKSLQFAIKEHEDNLKKPHLRRERSKFDDIHKLLIKCIERSRNINKFFDEFSTIFEKYCFIQIYCSGATILLCVFVARVSDWICVYFLALSGIYQLTLYSAVGSLVEIKSDEIGYCVYEIDWYCLTVSEQMMVRLLLQYVQQTIQIPVLGERKLNIETGIAVYKTIYSMFVMLEQFY